MPDNQKWMPFGWYLLALEWRLAKKKRAPNGHQNKGRPKAPFVHKP